MQRARRVRIRVTAKWFGLVRAVIIGGPLAALVVSGAWMSLFPVLRTMGTFPEATPRKDPVS